MVFSDLIQQIKAQIPVEIVHIQDASEIADVMLLDGNQTAYRNHVLYIGYSKQLRFPTVPVHCVLADETRPEAWPNMEGDLALVRADGLFALINAVKALLDASRSKGLYAELTDCVARSGSIASLINLAASELGNSIILLDTDFKVLEYSTVFTIDDPLWTQILTQGYCNYEFISTVNRLESVRTAPESSEPVVVTCSASPLRKLISRVFYNGRRVGTLVMLEKEALLSPAHFEQLRTVSAAAGDAIAHYAAYLLPDDTKIRRLLYELLIGTPPEELAPQIAALSLSACLCTLCIRQKRYAGPRQLKEHVAGALESLFPRLPFTFHENGIAALVPLGDRSGLSTGQLADLTDFAKTESLQIGISNVFSGVEHFAPQYYQACRAMELDKRLGAGNTVCRYSDYAFFDLLCNAKPPTPLKNFCDPALETLRRYDSKNDTDLFETLGTYLQCGCSIKCTAEKMFVHRNSLAYRLKRIAELTQVDLENSNTRFLLNMSYRILRFEGISPHAAVADENRHA